MEHAFKIHEPNGSHVEHYSIDKNKENILANIKETLKGKEWFRINYHKCFNDEQKPCYPWEKEIEHGDIPSRQYTN